MFFDMFKSIRDGNAYRLEKYGKNDTIAESFKKARESVRKYKETLPKSQPFFVTNENAKSVDDFKDTFEYWDGWTGGRFVREQNPLVYSNKSKVNIGTICRSNPVTGYWEVYTGE